MSLGPTGPVGSAAVLLKSTAAPLGSVDLKRTQTLEEEVESQLVNACLDLRWMERREALERLLHALSWWLDVRGHPVAALTASGVERDLSLHASAEKDLEKIFEHTDTIDVEDLLGTWDEMTAKQK